MTRVNELASGTAAAVEERNYTFFIPPSFSPQPDSPTGQKYPFFSDARLNYPDGSDSYTGCHTIATYRYKISHKRQVSRWRKFNSAYNRI